MIHIENINVYMQSNPELDNDTNYSEVVRDTLDMHVMLDMIQESIAKQSQGVAKAHTDASNASQSTPNPPPGYDWILSSQYEGLKQRSDAWNAVCDLITELDPNWHSGPGTGRVKALKAIRKLAGSNQG